MSRKSNRTKAQAERRALARLQSQVVVDESRDPTVQVGATITSTTIAAYSGPIPPAQELARYDEVVPGSAAKIIDWTNRQSEHRQKLESRALWHELARSYLGLGAGCVVALAQIAAGTYCVISGHDVAGAFIITGIGVEIVTAFIYGTKSRRLEREGRISTLTRRQQIKRLR